MIPFLWQAVLTSAAVAALVSSAITLLGQILERRARRKELLFTRALEMATRRVELMDAAAAKGPSFFGEVRLAEYYYRWLLQLFETGKLPQSLKNVAEKFRLEEEQLESEREQD